MRDLLSELPARFRSVSYNAAQIPDAGHDLSQGANCQRYAYAVLAHFGLELPSFRSSNLWEDREWTEPVSGFEPLDLLLFSRDGNAYGAHVAVYAGAGWALHLARSVGLPAQWTLAEFAAREEYRVLIGGKRVLAQQ